MLYTIKDLSEGRCAVVNDGTLQELETVLNAAFPKDKTAVNDNKYYYINLFNPTHWLSTNCELYFIPTQSVKIFLKTMSMDV